MSDTSHPEERTDEGSPSPNAERSLSRRRALQILGAVPVAAALGTAPPAPFNPGVELPPATETESAQKAAPKFFTAHEWATVNLLVDYIIPRDEHSGSATDAKVPQYMDYLLSERDANPNTQLAMRGGLGWLDNECRRRFQKTFIAATDVQRRQVLDDIAYPAKAPKGMSYGVSFFNRFRDMTASGFYSSAIGWKDLQYMGNVTNPGYDGCPPAALEKLGVSYDLMNTRVSPQEK